MQYNEGEDTVLTIDLIIAIVTIVKGIAKLAKLLPKFTKWINEVFIRRRTRKFRELFSTIKGKPIDLQLLKKLQKEFEELGGEMRYNKESWDYVEKRGKSLGVEVEAITLGEELIMLGKKATRSAVYEELIHARQVKSGLFNETMNKYGYEITDNLMEKYAAEELLKRASEWKLPKEEIELIKQRLEFFIEELKILGYEN